MIIKIYRERGKSKRSRGGEEEMTNPYQNYASSPQEF
jgi:hypothetical protein